MNQIEKTLEEVGFRSPEQKAWAIDNGILQQPTQQNKPMATALAEPRKIDFDMTPQTWPEKISKFIPPALRGRKSFFFGGRSPQEDAKDYGLYWIKITRGCVGIKPGEFFNIGDVVQVPGNSAMLYVEQDQAEFVRDEKIEDEVRFLSEAKAKGYTVQGQPKRLADRPEFQAVLDAATKKKKGWMNNVIQETPATA
jgi:hypothetical protein